MSLEIRDLLKELFGVAMMENREDFTVFIDYAGHVNSVYARIAPTGWEREGHMQICWVVHLDGEVEYIKKEINESIKMICHGPVGWQPDAIKVGYIEAGRIK